MNTNEGNKIIAEFIGLKTGSGFGKLTVIYKGQYCSPHYHSSWEWLMPVVEKIEKMYHKGFGILINISGDGAYIGINETNAGANKYDGERVIANTLNANYFNDYPEAKKVFKIEGVWQAVVQFIQWYNKQKDIKTIKIWKRQ